jgi:hypothetical protein
MEAARPQDPMAQNDEFIREVDEEYRRDKIAQIWSRYSALIVAVAVLVVAGVGGWRYWEHRQEQTAQADAMRFDDAQRLTREEGKEAEAQAAFEALAKDGNPGYALLARFRLAAELGADEAEKGAAAYDALAADGLVSNIWQDFARLRAAWLRIDTAEPGAIRPSLERIATPTNTWRHSARELLGLSGLKAGDMDFAGRWFDQIAADQETPAGLRQRLEVYTALVAGGPVPVTQ